MSFEKIRDPRRVRHWLGDMECDYIYTAGVAGERFLTTIRDEAKLLATRCGKCKITYLPPRIYCERCQASLDDWIEVPKTGTIQTFTTVHMDNNGEPLSKPITLAFIRIDNTDGGLIHAIGGTKPEALRIGMRVEAVFQSKSKRTGALTDIKYFKPV